jgi:hypothetical protein
MRRGIALALVLTCFCSVALAQTATGRGPSTPEERKRFLAIAHKFEENPLDKSLWPEEKWALQWVQDIPDITVTPCPPLLTGPQSAASQSDSRRPGEDFLADYKYAHQLAVATVFGNVAFMIEHPNKAPDNTAGFVAGVESALRAYKAILKTEPTAKSRTMDDLLQKQSQGKLVDAVREAGKDCVDDQQASRERQPLAIPAGIVFPFSRD